MLNSSTKSLGPKSGHQAERFLRATLLLGSVGVALGLLVVWNTNTWGMDRVVTWLLLAGLACLTILLMNKRDLLDAQNVLPFLALVVVARTGMVILQHPISWVGLGVVSLRGGPSSAINASLVVTMISLISYYAGFCSPVAPALSRLLPRPRIPAKGGHLFILVLCMLVTGVASQLLLIQRLGGIQLVIENIGVRKDTSGLGLLVLASNLAMAGVLVLYFLARTKRALGIAFFGGVIVAGFQFWMGRRGNAIPLVLFAVFVYHYKWRPIRIRSFIVVGLAVYILLGMMLLVRLYVQYPGYRSAILANPFKFYFVNMTGDLVIVDSMYTIVGHEDGFSVRVWSLDHWYSFIPYMLPRAIFPWKPVYLALPDRIYARYINPNIANGIPATIVGTLYLNAGYLGVVLGSYLLGLFAKGLVQYRDRSKSGLVLLIYTVAIFVLLQICRNGDLTNVISMSLSQFGGLFVAYAAIIMWRVLHELRNTLHSEHRRREWLSSEREPESPD